MKSSSGQLLLIVAAALNVAACSRSSVNAPAEDTNAHAGINAIQAVVSAPTVDTLPAREKQASEAYARGDGAFFTTFLSDNPVMVESGTRLDKADVI